MKKIIPIILALVLVIGFFACDDEGYEDYDDEYEAYNDRDDENEDDEDETYFDDDEDDVYRGDHDLEWVMYWYLCGSDLESYYGSASDDLFEMMDVDLPENVAIIIQTGGATSWYNDFVDPNYLERYIYSSDGLELIEQAPLANMGEASTLSDFLNFAETNYPANRTMLNFWNHGGGSLTGAAFDELFYNDSLTLGEMYSSLEQVYGANPETYPLDIVGFDTCLMATLSTANAFASHANYLVASQELEPGNGWYYSGIMDALAENPTISPKNLGVVICDTYVDGCEYWDTDDEITLSVTDLSKLPELIDAYERFGIEAFSFAIENPVFFNHLAQTAKESENYGGNTRQQGYTNMVDLGQLVLNTQDMLPENSQAVLDALDEAVVYKVDSIYRPDGMGLSTYYTYDKDIDNLYAFMDVNPAPAFNYLYHYGLTGHLDENGVQYLNDSLNYYEPLPVIKTLSSVSQWEGIIPYIDDEGSAVIDLGPEAYDILSFITFELYYSPVEDDLLLSLGSDNDINADWDNGVFADNFRGVWGHLDGALCYMDLVYEGDDFNEYSVPVYLNGEEYNLNVIYDFNYEEYIILGARKPLSDLGAADKNMVDLEVGNTVDIISYASSFDPDEDFYAVVTDSIVVSEYTSFTEESLPDGYYFLTFRMEDAQGNIYYSDIVTYESYEGEWFTYYE